MKFTTTAAAIAALATTTIAQLSSLPTCALQPALAAIGSSGCQATDIKCICSNQAYIAALQPAIVAACSPDDQAKALAASQTLCEQAGVPLVLPSASASAAPASTSAAAAPAASTTSASMSMSTSTPTAPANGTMHGNGSMSASATPAPYTGSGAGAPTAVWQVAVGVVAAGAGFAMALL